MLLLDFSGTVLRTVLWVSTSFLIISSFVQKFFFRRDIFSSKNFSCCLGRLLLTSLFKYLEKESIFSSRGPIHNSQIYLTHKTFIIAGDRYRRMMIFRDGGMNIIRKWNQCIIQYELLNNCRHCVTRCYFSRIW